MIKRHYDRVIVVCGFLFLFANMGLASTAFSVHQPYIVAMEGIGDAGGSFILSVRTGVSLLAMLFVDRYYRFLDVRVGVTVATLCTAAGFLVYSFAYSQFAFLAGAVFLGLGYGMGGMVAITYLANRWFANGLGSMVGIASMGSGFATIVVPMVVMQIINHSSLHVAFLCESACAAVIALLMLLAIRNRPSDLQMDQIAHAVDPDKTKKRRLVYRALPVPRGQHLLLLVAMTCVGVFSCCGITYISVLATSHGFSTLLAASLVSIAGIALTVSKFVTGELFDHLGGPRASAIMFAIGMAGYGMCCFAFMGHPLVMVGGAMLLGFGLALGSVGVSVWSIDLSNRANRAREIKNFQVAYAVGAFIANTLPGIVKDLAGSYTYAYAGIVVIAAIAAIIILRYYATYMERVPEEA